LSNLCGLPFPHIALLLEDALLDDALLDKASALLQPWLASAA
jgi:hypothetical protein